MLKSSSIWCAVSLLVALLAAFILTFPNPELDWDETHLPNAQRYMQELELTTQSTTTKKEYPLRGLVIAITGSTSGIGLELTRTLSKLGATVLAIGRSSTKLERLFGDNPNVEPVLADLNDLASVSTASQHILQRYHQLDVLVNNAGIHTGFSGMWTRTTTKQGYEPTFGVNYLSHFLLTEQLLPLMVRTSKKPKVVQISSSFHRAVDGSDLGVGVVGGGGGGGDTAQKSSPIASVPGGSHGFLLFKSQRQYANSKLAQIYHARSLQKRYHTAGVTAVSICPAWVGTQIGSKEGTWMHTLFKMAVFPADGYGLSSILHAIFDDNDHSENQDDFYVNANIPGIERMETFLNPSWMYSLVPIRDLWGSLFAGFLLIAERFFPFYGTVKSSHPSYDERHQNELYEWSRDAVSEWL